MNPRAYGHAALALLPVATTYLDSRVAHRSEAEVREVVARRAAAVCRHLHLEIQHPEPLARAPGQGRLICANHLGYVDVLALIVSTRGVFVAAENMASWPVLGHLMRACGTLFVKRTGGGAATAISVIGSRLDDGLDVIVFPEGTPSRGDQVAPFRTGTFQAAIDANADVVPTYVALEEIDGVPAAGSIRDRVCWYRDETGRRPNLLRHVTQVAALRSVAVTVKQGVPIGAAGMDRSELAVAAREVVQGLAGDGLAAARARQQDQARQ